jgi:hypothetical protein
MLIYNDQSQYVYENKRNMDEMTAEESDIYGNMTWILQKNSEFDGQFSLNDAFLEGLARIFREATGRGTIEAISKGDFAVPAKDLPGTPGTLALERIQEKIVRADNKDILGRSQRAKLESLPTAINSRLGGPDLWGKSLEGHC